MAVDTPAPLDLMEVVDSALRTHPMVTGAAARLAATEAAAGEARAARWPTLAASAVLTEYEEPMVVAPLHGFDLRSPPTFDRTLYQGHAEAGYTLFDGARAPRIRSAEGLASAAESGVAAARSAVMVDATSAYLEALSAREVLAAHEQRVRALEEEHDRSRQMFDQGKAPRVNVLRTEAALSRARAERETADQRLRLALRRVARVAGLPPARVVGATLRPVALGDEPALERDTLVAEARSSNPTLEQARRRVAALEARVSAARAAYLPRLALTGRYSAYGSPATELAPEWNAGVQLSYPLFTGGARPRAVERAAAEAEAARADAEQGTRQVEDAVDAALLAYRSARARVQALEAAVAQSAEVARIEALALDAGAGVQTDYLSAEASLLEARASLAEARHSVVEARVRLAQAVGRLTTDWLEGLTEEVAR